jgi:hypothetical protein
MHGVLPILTGTRKGDAVVAGKSRRADRWRNALTRRHAAKLRFAAAQDEGDPDIAVASS